MAIAMSRDTRLVFAYRNALINWVTDKLYFTTSILEESSI